MEKEKLTIDSGALSMYSTELNLPKSHSIIALNLQTVEDIEQVIRQCEALKGQMQGGLNECCYPTYKDANGLLCTDLSRERGLPIVSADWVDDAIAFFRQRRLDSHNSHTEE